MPSNVDVNANTTTSEWDISTDIYSIVDSVNDLKARYIDDEDETTLALGIFGYLTDTESKKIQSSIIMTGELGNEMFPARAKLTKNVLTHAIYVGIEDINAVPAQMTINIGIKVDDLNQYMVDNKLYIDYKSPIFVGDYEFHFDYDIILSRSEVSPDTYVYSAHYDMSEPNRISDITDEYLKQPFVTPIGNYDYVIFQANVRQCTIEETTDKIISESVIENKTYTFEFENQLVDFDVYLTENGKTYRLQPFMYGCSTEDVEYYCWYLFVSENVIRITFDSKSKIPGLNTDILIRAWTTQGADGVFNYKTIDETYEGMFIELASDRFNYSKLTCYMVAGTDSLNGSDRKSKSELRKLVPKYALSRGSITTETDLNNYFNLIDSEERRIVLQKKADNQLQRTWYGYFLLKDESNNVIPTNTIDMRLVINDGTMNLGEDGRYILPAGSIIRYIPSSKLGYVIDEALVPELYSDAYYNSSYYYYMTVYNIIINPDPLYAAFYLSISNKNHFFTYVWTNETSELQFVAARCNFQRNLLTDQHIYKFTFNMAQSVTNDFDMYVEETVSYTDDSGDVVQETIITNNMKCILVLYRENAPYRWVEATLTEFSKEGYWSSWEIQLETDNALDNDNYIKILDLHVAGSATSVNYGYFEHNTKAVLYILGKFEGKQYGRYDLDTIAPGFDEYSVTNVYEVDSGLDFYENFTNVLNTRVEAMNSIGTNFNVYGVPVVGLHYMMDEDYADYFIDAIIERKAYIDYCLLLLENSLNVDFKFFNTYGPSVTYSIGDAENTMIDHVDLCMKFRASLKSASDVYTKDDLIAAIKSYIEDLQETGDFHVPNMITDITQQFSANINYLEFMNFNDFWLGVQHIVKLELDDPRTVPEFLNIRNRLNEEGELEPWIDIEITY